MTFIRKFFQNDWINFRENDVTLSTIQRKKILLKEKKRENVCDDRESSNCCSPALSGWQLPNFHSSPRCQLRGDEFIYYDDINSGPRKASAAVEFVFLVGKFHDDLCRSTVHLMMWRPALFFFIRRLTSSNGLWRHLSHFHQQKCFSFKKIFIKFLFFCLEMCRVHRLCQTDSIKTC